jgi:alanyl-tRNA synthetase
VKGLRILTLIRDDLEVADLRKLGDQLRDKAPDLVAVIAAKQSEKISILAVCGKDAVAHGIKAGALVKEVCAVCGGSGGGKPDSAMGGGKDPAKVDNALALVDEFVASKLN